MEQLVHDDVMADIIWSDVAKSAAALRNFGDHVLPIVVEYWTKLYRQSKTKYNELTGRGLPLNF